MAEITIRSVMAERAEREETTWSGTLELTGTLDDRLNQIFRAFNRVDYGDGERLEALGYRLPSLSVGDEVTIDGATFRVEPVGFERIDSRANLG
jgi:hypothetical protein